MSLNNLTLAVNRPTRNSDEPDLSTVMETMKITSDNLLETAKKVWPEVAELNYSDIDKSLSGSQRCYVMLHFDGYYLHISKTPSRADWQAAQIFDGPKPSQTVKADSPAKACAKLEQLLKGEK